MTEEATQLILIHPRHWDSANTYLKIFGSARKVTELLGFPEGLFNAARQSIACAHCQAPIGTRCTTKTNKPTTSHKIRDTTLIVVILGFIEQNANIITEEEEINDLIGEQCPPPNNP